MAQVLVRNLREQTVEALKQRAKQHNRSLQQELKGVLEQAAQTPLEDPATAALRIRERLRRRRRTYSDSTRLIREDRTR